MSKVVNVVLRIASIAVSFIPGFGQLSWILRAAIMIGLNVGAMLTTPKARQPERQASVTALQLGEVPREALIGRAATGGSLANAFNYGGKYGNDWEVLSIVLADHECDALEGFWVNDVYVPFGGDGTVAGYSGQLEVYFRPGTENQSVPSVLSAYGGYAASDNGAGMCHVTVCYKADASDAKNPVWPGGRPRFLWVVRGLKCYDAREDSTAPGGLGAHRWADPATREWSENPIVARYTWVRGIYACNRVDDPDMLLVGRGLTAIEAPPGNVAARANLCDEVVTLSSGSEPRYRCGGVVRADDAYLNIEELFASACAGVITQPQGCIEIEPGYARAPSFFFTDADLIVGSEVQWNDFRGEADQEWINTLVPRYVEPTMRWADHAAPIRREVADVIEDGGPREETLSLPMVTSATQAGRCGEIRRRVGRLQGHGSLTLGPRFCEVEEGDWGVWTSARRFGGAGRTVRVEAWTSAENGHMQLQLRQMSASCFSDGPEFDDGSVAAPPVVIPNVGKPAVGSWALTAGVAAVGASGLPAIKFIGTVDDSYARFVKLEYWKSDGVTAPAAVTNWTSAGLFGPDTLEHAIPGLASGAVYYGAVSYMVDRFVGERLILGPVTVPTFSIADIMDVVDNFSSLNDRDGSPIAPATIAVDGTATDHTLTGAGNADVSAEWLWAGDERSIDWWEFLLVSRPQTGIYTIGSNTAIETIYQLPRNVRAFIAYGQLMTNCITWAVRPVRVVHPDVNASRRIYGLWRKPSLASEQPYRPADNLAFEGNITGTVAGVAASSVSATVINFAARIRRDATPIPGVTIASNGSAIDHVNRDNAACDISFRFSYLGAVERLHWFDVMVRSSTSALVYVPGTNETQELIVRIPARKWALILQGVSQPLNYTFAARGVREVDLDIDPTGEIHGPWVKSTATGEDPYRPEIESQYLGLIGDSVDGVPATVVAATVDPVTGNIAGGKVVADSIDDDAINVSDWKEQGLTLIFDPSDSLELTWSGSASQIAGDRVVLGYSYDWEISVTNPTQGQEFWFDIKPHRANVSGVVQEDYSGWREGAVWTGPNTTGTFTMGRRMSTRLRVVEGPPAGDWHFGLTVDTPPQNGLVIYPGWAINVDDKRAGQ